MSSSTLQASLLIRPPLFSSSLRFHPQSLSTFYRLSSVLLHSRFRPFPCSLRHDNVASDSEFLPKDPAFVLSDSGSGDSDAEITNSVENGLISDKEVNELGISEVTSEASFAAEAKSGGEEAEDKKENEKKNLDLNMNRGPKKKIHVSAYLSSSLTGISSVSASTAANGVESSVSVPTPTSRQRELYKKLSKLSITGRTVAETLNQFIMEGTTVRKDDLFRCAKDLRRFRRHQHALEIFDWIEKRKMTLSVTDHAVRLDLIAKTKGLKAAEEYLDNLDPSEKNHQSTHGALMNCYCVELNEEKAKAHFEKMDELKFVNNSLPYNNMMSMYMRLGQPEKVPLLVDAMKQRGISPCGITYSIWMQSCGSLNDLEWFNSVYLEIIWFNSV